MTAFAGTASFILDSEEVQSGLKSAPILIEKIFQTLLAESFQPKDLNGVYLNKYILEHAVESYYCDLYRLTIFRGITADHHKQAAFLIKWITMLRPVQIHAHVVNPRLPVLLCNELLAVVVGLVVLFRSVAVPRQIITDEADYIYHLVYLLHFHSCISPEQLASELYQLEKRYIDFAEAAAD